MIPETQENRVFKLAAPDLPKGSRFDSDTHTYYDSHGRPGVSVTMLLKEIGFLGDTSFFTDSARDRGTAVHAITHYLDEGTLDETTVDPRLAGYAKSWQNFKDRMNFQSVWHECKVWHPTFNYYGTFDRFGIMRQIGTWALIDIKTGVTTQPYWGLQLRAYLEALIAFHPEIKTLGVKMFSVRLMEDGSDAKIDEWNEPRDFATFCCGLEIYNWQRKHNKRKVPNEL